MPQRAGFSLLVFSSTEASLSRRPGLAFLTLHFPDKVDTNQLTIEGIPIFSAAARRRARAAHPFLPREIRLCYV
ncbi:MAG TPA: hypothetical protein VJB88_07930 [Vicinamibacteria bacterium]|nr:hypothetical protein [Vicinamibacteria bacterium]